MSRLIEAEELKNAVYNSFAPYQRDWATTIHQINKVIDVQPTVEAVPVVHGEWKHKSYGFVICSECGNVIEALRRTKFCAECGADMRRKV